MMRDFRLEGAPADIATYLFPPTILVFQYTFSGTTYYIAIRSGMRGWNPISIGTNPRTVLQAAFNAMVSGDSVEITRGTYTIGGALTIDGKNLLLILDDGATIYLANATDTNMLNLSNITKFTKRGRGTFDGNKANQTDVNIKAISCTNVKNLIVEGPCFKDAMNGVYATPVDISLTGRNRIIDSTFTGCEGTIYYADAINCMFDDCFVGVYYGSIIECIMHRIRHGGVYLNRGDRAISNHIRPAAGASMTAINIEYGNLDDIAAIGNDIDLTGGVSCIGIGVSPNVNNQTAEKIVLDGNIIKGATSSAIFIKEHGVIGVTIRNITIDNNVLSDSTKYGVEIDYPQGGAIPSDIFIGAGNKFINNGYGRILPKGHRITIEEDPTREYIQHIPGCSALFLSSVAGGGSISGNNSLLCNTGALAGATASGSRQFNTVDHSYTMNFDKEFMFEALIRRLTADANAVAYLKFDDDLAPVNPGSKAIGFKIINMAVWGFVHDGTNLTLLNLATVLTDGQAYRLKIHFVPARTACFYIDDIFVGSIDSNLPSGTQANAEEAIAAITNGASAVEVRLYLHSLTYRKWW